MVDPIERIVATAKDYQAEDGFVFDRNHVEAWIRQFDPDHQAAILSVVAQALDITYFSKEAATTWLRRILRNEKFVSGDPAAFWPTINFLNIQERGRSQREMLVILSEAMEDELGITLSECGSADGAFVYLDDGLFSGGHIRNDLENWIKNDAPEIATVHILTVAQYSYGCWYTRKELKKIGSVRRQGTEFCILVRQTLGKWPTAIIHL